MSETDSTPATEVVAAPEAQSEHVTAETPEIIEDVVEDAADIVEDVVEDAAEELAHSVFVIREIIGRQVVAGQGLTTELVEVATDLGEALAHAPAVVISAIRGGATLPAAVSQSGSVVSEVVVNAGDRFRTAVGGYVERQATLPNAVISGAAGVASTVIRAQGVLGGSAVNAVFAVAAAATDGDDVRGTFDREVRDVSAKAGSARVDIAEAIAQARTEIASAVTVFDESNEALGVS